MGCETPSGTKIKKGWVGVWRHRGLGSIASPHASGPDVMIKIQANTGTEIEIELLREQAHRLVDAVAALLTSWEQPRESSLAPKQKPKPKRQNQKADPDGMVQRLRADRKAEEAARAEARAAKKKPRG
jgi:hypothetical protein